MTEHGSHDVGIYYKVFGALLVFTVITVAVNRVHLAIPLAVTVALIIAVTKGSLVASFFMHLISESNQIYRVLVLTAIFFFFLMFLPLLGLFSTPAGTEHRSPLTPATHATAEGHH
ncbi:MAG: cytochrome C oxidase subunit IV family protein [Acidobacteria bacterium]|nr:cytochrome C oxidase subunit IV family protein [Acidobacteriota bacterium]